MKLILEKVYAYKNEGEIIDYSLNLGGSKFSLVLTLKNNEKIEIMTKYNNNFYSLRKDTFFVQNLYESTLLIHLKKLIKRNG